MKILVTGSTGFIGQYIVSLLSKNNNVELIKTAKQSDDNFSEFDLFNFNPNENLYQHFGNPDVLIHLAWAGLPDYNKNIHILQVEKHFSVIKNLISNGLKKVIVTGTCLEYGLQEGCLSENDLVKPSINYAIGKNKLRLEIENLQKQYKFDFNWIRLFYIYGKGQSPKSILAQLDSAVINNERIFNMSFGEQQRDYLPVETVANYIIRIALQNKYNGIVNCCSGTPIKIKDLVINHINNNNLEITLNLGYYKYNNYEPFAFWGNNSLLKSVIDAT